MAITGHVTTRVYGEVFGSPPFQNASGQAAFSNFKNYPIAPLTSVQLGNATLWPLQNGYQTPGGTYVYSVIEIQASGLNVESTKLATDTSVTNLTSSAT